MTKVTMRKGFNTVVLALDTERGQIPTFITDSAGECVGVEMKDADIYRVSAVSIYGTANGGRVDDVREHTFSDRDEARAYANGWYARLIREGWERIR